MSAKRYELVGLAVAELRRAREALGIVLPDSDTDLGYHEITRELFIAELPNEREYKGAQ